MIEDRSRIREGMAVYSSDGEKLGKVLSCDASTFTIEKGFFFPKDYVARYEHVANVSGDDIMLSMSKAEFTEMREGGTAALDATSGSETRDFASRTSHEDVSMPVVEEELDVVKRDRQAGEVRLRKDVITETKHIEVPVTREEVRVERVPVDEQHAASPGDRLFERDSVSVPIHEEEIEIRKRPVVKEQVHLRKERVTEQRAADADIRRERVEIEGEEGAHLTRRGDEEIDRSERTDLPRGSAPMRDDDLP